MKIKQGSFVHITREKWEQEHTYVRDTDGKAARRTGMPCTGFVVYVHPSGCWATVLLCEERAPFRPLYKEAFWTEKLSPACRPKGMQRGGH